MLGGQGGAADRIVTGTHGQGLAGAQLQRTGDGSLGTVGQLQALYRAGIRSVRTRQIQHTTVDSHVTGSRQLLGSHVGSGDVSSFDGATGRDGQLAVVSLGDVVQDLDVTTSLQRTVGIIDRTVDRDVLIRGHATALDQVDVTSRHIASGLDIGGVSGHSQGFDSAGVQVGTGVSGDFTRAGHIADRVVTVAGVEGPIITKRDVGLAQSTGTTFRHGGTAEVEFAFVHIDRREIIRTVGRDQLVVGVTAHHGQAAIVVDGEGLVACCRGPDIDLVDCDVSTVDGNISGVCLDRQIVLQEGAVVDRGVCQTVRVKLGIGTNRIAGHDQASDVTAIVDQLTTDKAEGGVVDVQNFLRSGKVLSRVVIFVDEVQGAAVHRQAGVFLGLVIALQHVALLQGQGTAVHRQAATVVTLFPRGVAVDDQGTARDVRRAAGSQDQAAVQRGGTACHRDGAGVVDVVGLAGGGVVGEGVGTVEGDAARTASSLGVEDGATKAIGLDIAESNTRDV